MARIAVETKPCIGCGFTHLVEMDEVAFQRWVGGELIQWAAPELNDEQRELLISGICGPCFDRMYGEDEEEGDTYGTRARSRS